MVVDDGTVHTHGIWSDQFPGGEEHQWDTNVFDVFDRKDVESITWENED